MCHLPGPVVVYSIVVRTYIAILKQQNWFKPCNELLTNFPTVDFSLKSDLLWAHVNTSAANLLSLLSASRTITNDRALDFGLSARGQNICCTQFRNCKHVAS